MPYGGEYFIRPRWRSHREKLVRNTLTENNQNSGFKLVTISYTEQASLVVKADTDEAAEKAVLESFAFIPDLKIVLIEEAPEDTVREAKANAQMNERVVN